MPPNPPEPLKPHWVNAPGFDSMMRSYGSYDGVLVQGHESLCLKISSAPKRFVVVFGSCFLPFIAWVGYQLPPAAAAETIVQRSVVAGLLFVFGLFAFGLIYGLMWRHEKQGDYLLVDRVRQTIALPRLDKEFPLGAVESLQVISGRSRHHPDVDFDLNLLVREGEQVVRYHIMGNQLEKDLQAIAEYAKLAIERIGLGSQGNRYADANDA